MIARRALLASGGAHLSSAAVGTASDLAHQRDETPEEKVERLADELAEALNDVLFGKFRAVVEPSRSSRCPVMLKPMRAALFDLGNWLNTAPAKVVAEYHAAELAAALNRVRPGLWVANPWIDPDVALIVRHESPDGRCGSAISYV